jgi:tetratricopeptide (TPR) repeat protein
MRRNTLIALIAAVLAAFAGTGCTQLKARDQLNKGVQAFKLAKYEEAVDHFKIATELDPTFAVARLYLATAYMSQYIPGAESPDNLQKAKNAHDEFMKVLDQKPDDTTAIASIASMYYHQKKTADAEEWYDKLVSVDPNNKEGFYTLGVIAWTKSFEKRMTARANMGMKPEDPGPLKDKKVREEVAAQLTPIIEKGINSLNKSIEIDPKYADAMAYLNLLHRERADLRDNPEDYKKDTQIADEWVQKTMDTKKLLQEELEKSSGGITQEGQ